MAKKNDLRKTRAGKVINLTSKRQETTLEASIAKVIARLKQEFGQLKFIHESQVLLQDVVADLRIKFPEVDFHHYHAKSSMRPDGGILYLIGNTGLRCPILIAEKKNQGTNDLRSLEGKEKQAKGNAIERLGKNVIGFRAVMLGETIFPFVCFGDGCDFAPDSSIVDRVVTIAMFGHLNKEYLHASCAGQINRGSFYFRVAEWTQPEMEEICYSIANKAVFYYYSRHGAGEFLPG